MRTLAILIAFSVAAFGQRHKAPEEVDAEKPDGKLMQQIMQESDPAKKNTLMEQYASEFPKLPHTAWVLETVKKYSDVTAKNARKVAASAEPKDAEEAKAWKHEVESAKSAEQYADY